MKAVTETELKAKAVAPRVTQEALDANIKTTEYIFHGLLTLCVLTLQNGFTVTGESACASAENYNADIGSRIAYANAKEKIWPLMGYALREELHALTKIGAGDLFLDESLTMLLAHSRGNNLVLTAAHADAILDYVAQVADDTDPSFLVPLVPPLATRGEKTVLEGDGWPAPEALLDDGFDRDLVAQSVAQVTGEAS